MDDKDRYAKMFHAAEAMIERSDAGFENIIQQLRYLNYNVLARSDEFIVYDFKRLINDPYDYLDRELFYKAKEAGTAAIEHDDIDGLRRAVDTLWSIKIDKNGDGTDVTANIVRG